jgi:outer membrane protein assembly factor BamA
MLRHLNATIHLSPLTKRSIRAELQAVTKSNNFTGPNLGLTYTNRNIFKGGENFSATGNIGYEKQLGNKTNGSSSLQLGTSISMTYPRLIFPGNLDKYFKYSIPKTKVSIGADYFRRTKLYSLNSYSASFGYIWNANRYVTHHLDPIKINYVQLGKSFPVFDSILEANPFLKRSFDQQFIAGLTYSFTYNEFSNKQKKGHFNIKLNFDIAGNTVGLIGKIRDSDSTKTVLGLSYAQYVKVDLDLSYHYNINYSEHTLVGRVFGGIGVPYGNSQTLPYIKQYFSGGSYSVRAFQIRGIGPGVYDPPNDNNLLFDRSGDIRLEGNLEYRFPIISVLKGALFVDAGNIWNLNDNLSGGRFTSDFIHQFGIGTGLGLRVDVQGFVIRFDLAAPLKRPATDWTFDYKNPVFNFAIGYPF